MKIDMNICGTGTAIGGEYGKVTVSGSGKIQGNVRCISFTGSGSTKVAGNVESEEKFSCSGSAKIQGNLTCGGKVGCSGAFRCEGNVKASQMSCSGAAKIAGAAEAKDAHFSGAVTVLALKAGSLCCSGSTHVEKSVDADEAELSGRIEIGDLLNAETIRIQLDSKYHESRIGSIGGSDISVKAKRRRFSSGGKLTTSTVEGDEIYLENTTADTVRGKNVTLGPGCVIRRVEYAGNFSAAPDSQPESVEQY